MEALNDIEQHWSEQFRLICATVAGVKLFDDMWVEEKRPIGTKSLPWTAVSIEYPFIEDEDEITLAIRAFSFDDSNNAKPVLKDVFLTSSTKAAYKDEMYVPAEMISEDSLMKAAKKGFSALEEFGLSFNYPFIVQVMTDDGEVEFLIEINEF